MICEQEDKRKHRNGKSKYHQYYKIYYMEYEKEID